MKDAYFSSLIGRSVQVYRGGPNSNVGTLLDVSGDYLALQKENGEIIYYKTSHIKSIKENSQGRFNVKVYENSKVESSESVSNTVQNPNALLLQAHSFSDLAVNFKEQLVRINGKGPESKVGKLIDVKADYLILHDEQDGLTFYQEEHITSLSIAVLENEETDEEKENENENENEESSSSDSEAQLLEEMNNLMEVYDQICADDICGVLANLKYCWIKINRKGPESIEGLLVDINEDHLVLVVKNEIFRIATFHVKNISVGLNYTEEQSNNEKSENQNSNDESNQNTSNSNSNNRQSYEEHLNQMMRIKRRKTRQKAQQSNGE
ncbi:hypothetical protein [Paenisporosarcina indica]|uniref:hypothetical protein n=1 Tax=Paenisporosarcina indica TaxID=650093 RepID=UPI00094FD108|nr:hypothetical protein [Paenisporosarcina indica]